MHINLSDSADDQLVGRLITCDARNEPVTVDPRWLANHIESMMNLRAKVLDWADEFPLKNVEML